MHYRHLSLGNRVVALWLCGSLNSISIRFVFQATEQGYNTTYYIMRGFMEWIRGLPEKPLKGTTETDGAYVKAGSKGVTLDINGEGWTAPSCRGPPHGPGRGTTPKGQAETTIHFQRAMGKPDVTIMDVPRDGRH